MFCSLSKPTKCLSIYIIFRYIRIKLFYFGRRGSTKYITFNVLFFPTSKKKQFITLLSTLYPKYYGWFLQFLVQLTTFSRTLQCHEHSVDSCPYQLVLFIKSLPGPCYDFFSQFASREIKLPASITVLCSHKLRRIVLIKRQSMLTQLFGTHCSPVER